MKPGGPQRAGPLGKRRIPQPPWKLDKRRLARFRAALLGWFWRHRRDLPWRRTRDPYRIWISEVMLQQTRVAAVLPYYLRFLERFPDVRQLAIARLGTVLRFWAGLGYYSRARNLHRAARQITARHGGEFPRILEQALALPGIGGYTAAAVLSIAYGAPLAALDGNVARVLARLGALTGQRHDPANWRTLKQAASTLLAVGAAGDWNQALMELGATVCAPRAPRCDQCPLEKFCRARTLSIAERIPARPTRHPAQHVRLSAVVMLDARGEVLLMRPQSHDTRQAAGQRRQGRADQAEALFSRLWHFPAVESPNGRGSLSPRALAGRLAQMGAAPRPLGAQTLTPLATVRHSITFRHITLAPYLVRVPALPSIPNTKRLPLGALDTLAVSSATRKIAAAVSTEIRTSKPASRAVSFQNTPGWGKRLSRELHC